ncbi:hypothetical protein A4X13_0g7030 [Tilletia indica]|uniref:Uncharacterized protein n=1 Tax=Tilletia indica TaxID=43049 RepID=A0A177TV86_9BASI|nr:hypothetical protein A4X13_0g7030 [Tilletia indica]
MVGTPPPYRSPSPPPQVLVGIPPSLALVRGLARSRVQTGRLTFNSSPSRPPSLRRPPLPPQVLAGRPPSLPGHPPLDLKSWPADSSTSSSSRPTSLPTYLSSWSASMPPSPRHTALTSPELVFLASPRLPRLPRLVFLAFLALFASSCSPSPAP